MKFEVTILGSSSATPLFGRHQTAQLLNYNQTHYLIDCGEGTQMQLQQYGFKINRIKYIFISHLHGDHYLGVVGLISSMHLNGRTEELHVFGPAPLEEIILIQLKYAATRLCFSLIFHATEINQPHKIFENKELEVFSFPLDHRIDCTGFKFQEKQKLPGINIEKIEKLTIPKDYLPLIKKGFDYTDNQGIIHKSEALTTSAPEPRSYAFCSDTRCSWSYLAEITSVNLLYHESTFLHELKSRADKTYHTTAREAAEVAEKAHVNQLIIGHFSTRYKELTPFLAEAKNIFSATSLALEGSTFPV